VKDRSVLAALSSRRCFVVCSIIPRDTGKTDKVPIDPLTGRYANAQDPATWLYPSEAETAVAQWNLNKQEGVLSYCVAIVIYEGSQLFCIDLDTCRFPHGGWMPHVLAFESRFANAYRETSFSLSGRHIIGTYTGVIPPHRVKNKIYRMECYTRARLIALTGDEISGDVNTDYTSEFTAFLAEFFPEKEDIEHGVEWTDKPVELWAGPVDDTELINRALRSRSPRAIFGSGASFEDLWRGNEDALAKAFPSQNSHSAWDMSSADQALVNHLAFWTGNNCERMLTIMQQCEGLARSKWERNDYLRTTILDACGSQKEWYIEPKIAVPQPIAVEVGSAPIVTPEVRILQPGQLPPVGELCSIVTQKQMFAGMCHVQDINAIQLPDGYTLSKDRFDVEYGGYDYAMTVDGQRPSRSAWEAYTLSQLHRFPRVHGQFFSPSQPTGALRMKEDRQEINSYQCVPIRRVKGDPEPFLALVKRMLPKGQDSIVLISYMAACVQYLGVKFPWTVFLQGTKGNGKTTIAQIMEYCISHRYTHWAKASVLGEKFNSMLIGKLLVIVDEMYSDDNRELQETLKQLITAKRLEIRPMHGEKIMREVCFNMMLMSNYQNGVRIDADERRYAALFCAQQTKADRFRDGLTKSYFRGLHFWLWQQDGAAIVYDYLMDFRISDELDPTKECLEAPTTSSTEVAATVSLGSVEQEILESIKQGKEGFRGGWISSQGINNLLARMGKEKVFPHSARRGLVLGLGYIAHPALGAEARCDVPLIDGYRPYLYVTRGHPWALDYLTHQQVRDGFLEAQK
jgi:hypothetical protein